jgi:hypothetical protein
MINDLWYKNAVIYCLSVGTFMDSNGDGVGDFKGLVRRLDYLHGLGVTAIWLMPFQVSPHRDDGYDVSDYTASTRAMARSAISSSSPTARSSAEFACSLIWSSTIPRASTRGSSRHARILIRSTAIGTSGRRRSRPAPTTHGVPRGAEIDLEL